MARHLFFFVAILGASSSVGAKTQATEPHPLRSFDALVGDWQCQAEQMHLDLDRFELENIEAQMRFEVHRQDGSENLKTLMQATTSGQELLFLTRALITYDPQQSLFVQYETTEGGSDATLVSEGFDKSCVTWHYVSEVGRPSPSENPNALDLRIAATVCAADEGQKLLVDYTLHLADHEPIVLFAANCHPGAAAD